MILVKCLRSRTYDPVEIFSINQIPGVWTKNHNENFRFWRRFVDADVLKIDAHHDMTDYAPYVVNPQGNYYRELSIANHSCAAVHYRHFFSINWLNPYSSRRRLQFLGSRDNKQGLHLDTKIIKENDRCYQGDFIVWLHKALEGEYRIGLPELPEEPKEDYRGLFIIGRIIIPEEIEFHQGKPFILDVDLDGFCCNKVIDQSESPPGNTRITNYQQRIDETAEVLRRLNRRPDIITGTESRGMIGGHDDPDNYVPVGVIDEVKDAFMRKLIDVYG